MSQKLAPELLVPNEDDEFHIDIPGYDLRRLIMARDPLEAVNDSGHSLGHAHVSFLSSL